MRKIFYIVNLILLIGLILGYKELYNYKNLTSELIKENNNLQNSLKEDKNNNNKLKNQIVYLKNQIIYLENNITNLKDMNNILQDKLDNRDKIIIVPDINYSIETEQNIKDLNLSKPKSFKIKTKKTDNSSSLSPTIDVDMEKRSIEGFHINYTNKF